METRYWHLAIALADLTGTIHFGGEMDLIYRELTWGIQLPKIRKFELYEGSQTQLVCTPINYRKPQSDIVGLQMEFQLEVRLHLILPHGSIRMTIQQQRQSEQHRRGLKGHLRVGVICHYLLLKKTSRCVLGRHEGN